MIGFFWLWFGAAARFFRSRKSLLLENLALRQQLTVLKRRHPRSKLSPLDMLFWVLARKFWSAWKQSLLVVTPETVVRWHRSGFRLYWSLISRVRKQLGRRRLSKEVRDLIFQMVADNPTWGAPRIHLSLNKGMQKKRTLWSQAGQKLLRELPLKPWASCRAICS